MEVDVAVLGGGPGGYTAAIRAAQLGARVACIEHAPELGGTCLRIGCIPTKAWVQTAFSLKQAKETFGKLGVRLDEPKFEFSVANEWKAAAVRRMTRGVAYLFKANGVEWIRRNGNVHRREHAQRGQRGGSELQVRNHRDADRSRCALPSRGSTRIAASIPKDYSPRRRFQPASSFSVAGSSAASSRRSSPGSGAR